MDHSRLARTADAMHALCHDATDPTTFRVAVIDLLRRKLGFDNHVWVITDPMTTVGCAPYAEVPEYDALPRLIRAKYLTPEHRWTSGIDTARLSDLAPELAHPWRAAIQGYGVTDVASVVHADSHGTWAFLDLWRIGGAFTDEEMTVLSVTRPVVTRALRGLQARATTLTGPPTALVEARSGALIVDDDLRVVGDTTLAAEWLARLLPPVAGRAPVPAVVLNVAAQLHAVQAGVDDHPALARVHLGDGRWLTARADRLHDAGPGGLTAVTLAMTSPQERLELFCRAFGLTGRETELVGLLAGGHDTREIATTMHVSAHTVQDHLKSIFARTGTRTRRTLLSHALGTATPH